MVVSCVELWHIQCHCVGTYNIGAINQKMEIFEESIGVTFWCINDALCHNSGRMRGRKSVNRILHISALSLPCLFLSRFVGGYSIQEGTVTAASPDQTQDRKKFFVEGL